MWPGVTRSFSGSWPSWVWASEASVRWMTNFMSPVVTRWGAQRPFYCERSEPSCQERAPRSEAQRSALQQLVHIKWTMYRINLAARQIFSGTNTCFDKWFALYCPYCKQEAMLQRWTGGPTDITEAATASGWSKIIPACFNFPHSCYPPTWGSRCTARQPWLNLAGTFLLDPVQTVSGWKWRVLESHRGMLPGGTSQFLR